MVEWKKLGDICDIKTGKLNANAQEEDGKYPFFTCDANPFKINTFAFDTEAILVSGNGSQVGHLNYYKGKFNAYQRTYVIDRFRNIDVFYLYHYMKGTVRPYVMKKSKKGSVPYITLPMLTDLQIPIPSLQEQERIVGMLDTFTASIDNLKEQIAQRKKQYEHYRDQLLDLEGKPGVEMKTLGEICEIKGRIGFRGYTREDQVAKGEGALTLTATNIVNQRIDYNNNTYITWAKYYESPEIMVKNGDIIVCQRGSIGKVAIVENLNEEATINPQLLLLKNIKCNNRYLIHYMLSKFFQDSLNRIIGFGTIQMIAQKDLKGLQICILPDNEQQRIVSILDTFEASIANLEAQLAERQKQYEYYRNKLLSFE